MSRKAPSFDPPSLEVRKDPKMITQEREYELITPLFGGGVEPATADAVTVIRGSSIRGQLRFWWRATCGGQFGGNFQKMKEAEDELWGAASTPKETSDSRPRTVQLYVEIINRGKPLSQVKDRQGRQVRFSAPSSPYGYVAFPLQDKPQSYVLEGVSFSLHLEFPLAHQSEIESTLWAWETFGGIGARTRRGFGSLRCVGINKVEVPLPESGQFRANLLKALEQHVSTGTWPKDVPHLSRNRSNFRVVPENGDALRAWRMLIEKLRTFRQARTGNGRGRSRWPEPDAIRRRFPGLRSVHSEPVSNLDRFPRAEFGLPIIFDFKQGDGDPARTTLQGADHDRLASPLVIRPVACAGNRSVGLALILEAPRFPPKRLVLKGARREPDNIKAQLTSREADQVSILRGNKALQTDQPYVDILQAFLNFLVEKPS